MVLEILGLSDELIASETIENKKLCKKPLVYSPNYLTKCDTHYCTLNGLISVLEANPNMKVVWTIRDPRDLILSKIFRSQPQRYRKILQTKLVRVSVFTI